MEADGAPFTPLPLSVLRFTGIQSYGYTDPRKVEAEVTEDRTGDLSLRKPRTSQLSHDCFQTTNASRSTYLFICLNPHFPTNMIDPPPPINTPNQQSLHSLSLRAGSPRDWGPSLPYLNTRTRHVDLL